MKKLLLLLTILGCSLSSFAATLIGGINYELDDVNYTAKVVEKTPKYSGTLTIPASVTYNGNTYAVTTLGERAFLSCTSLNYVNMPEGLTTIENWAFYETGLLSISLPHSLTTVESEAFRDCAGATGSLTIHENVTYLGKNAFNGLAGISTLYMNAPNIDPASYYNSSSDAPFRMAGLKTVVIGSNVENIPDALFSRGSFTSITIPGTVKTIGKSAFEYCSKLTDLIIEEGVTTSGSRAFYGCLALVNVSLPSSLTTISESMFYACSGLTSITIPDGVTDIDGFAFESCRALTTVSLPSTVTNIGFGAFRNCSGLPSISIPSNVTNIGIEAFCSCTGLNTPVTIPSGVTIIMRGTFRGCTNLPSVTIPETVTIIDTLAFKDCKALNPVIIPGTVDSIGGRAFEGCSGLVDLTISEGVRSIGKRAFYKCTGLTSVTIPESLEHVYGGQLFQGCSGLKTVVWNAKDIKGKEYYSGSGYWSIFQGVTSIESVTFGEHVVRIPINLCYNMSAITSIEIPASVKYVDKNAFYGCTGITSVTCHATTPPACTSAFPTNAQSGKLYIPEGTKYAYHNKTYWKNFFQAVSLAETTANGSIDLTTYEDRYRDVTLTDRTIRTGGYNTLCLPFDMTAEDIAQSPLKDATIYRFVRATGNADDGLYINFAPTTSIEAGVPYIVTTETDIANPKFIASQIIENTGHSTMGDGTGNVVFVAHMYYTKLPAGDKSNLFFTADGLTWSEEGDATTMPAFRAYFHVNDASAVARRCPARVVLHEEVATALEYTPSSMDKENIAGASKSIINGQLVITRGEQQYTIQGQRIY